MAWSPLVYSLETRTNSMGPPRPSAQQPAVGGGDGGRGPQLSLGRVRVCMLCARAGETKA